MSLRVKKSYLSIFFLSLMLSPAYSNQIAISLSDILLSVQKHYPLLKKEEQNIQLSFMQLIAAKGAFDPSLDAIFKTTPKGGYENNYFDSEARLPTKWGGLQLFAGYRIGRGDFPIYFQNFLTNHDGEIRAGFELPLLRNHQIDKQRSELRTAQINTDISQKNYQQSLNQYLIMASKTYWHWLTLGHKYLIYKKLLMLAKTRAKALQKGVDKGDMAKLAMVENDSQLYSRQQMLVKSKQSFLQAAIDLSLYYRDNKGTPKVLGIKNLPSLKKNIKSLRKIESNRIDDLIEKQPIVKKIKLYKKQQLVKLNLTHNQILPELNLQAYTSKDYGQGKPKLKPQDYNLALRFKLPLFNRRAKGQFNEAKIHYRNLLLTEYYIKDRFRADISRLFTNIQTLNKQVAISQRTIKALKQVEKGEYIRFKNGDSDLFLVNQRETNTTQEQINLISLLTAYQENLNELSILCFQKNQCINSFITYYSAI